MYFTLENGPSLQWLNAHHGLSLFAFARPCHPSMVIGSSQEWFEIKGDASNELMRRFDTVRDQNQKRVDLNRAYYSLYYDREHNGYSASSLASLVGEDIRFRLQTNVIQRIVQALAAKMARQKPRPVVLTDGADWGLQQRAKKYEKFIWGLFHKLRVFELMRQCDLHALLTGTGVLYVGSHAGEVFCEVVPSSELYVDTAAARYGSPLEAYRRQLVDRRQLARKYPEKRREIEDAQAADIDESIAVTGAPNSDLIEVVTGWRLPSYRDSEDGRVVVAIKDAELSSGEWCRHRLPFVAFRYQVPPEGYWGIGVVEGLVGSQLELNRVNLAKQEAVHLLSAPFVLVEKGSSIVKSHLTNEVGRIIEYTGTPPQVVTPNAISSELVDYSERIQSGMFQRVGLSEMAAQGYKPAGLNSGKALRAYADMVDDSIHDVLLRREQLVVDVAELFLDEIEEIAEGEDSEERSDAVLYVGPFGTEEISFRECEMDRNSFVLKVQPASALSTTLSGKLEDLSDLRELGLVSDPAEMQDLLQLPDLEAAAARRNSMRNLLLEVLEVKVLGDGVSVTPEPTWDLQTALKLCRETRLRAQLRNAPEDRIELLHSFEESCIYWLNQANAQQGPQGAAPEPQPPTDPLMAAQEGQALPLGTVSPEMSPIPGGEPGVV